ncbi:MAG: SGNH/GDSL hydrolase family protein [Ferruginibacter sp.]
MAGLKNYIIYILILGLFSQCKKNPVNGGGYISQPAVQKTYLALGDSYTIGQSVPENDRFPVQTKNLLAALGINFQAPEIIAATGWTTQNLMNAINAQNFAHTYDVVSLLIGVNDQYQTHDTTNYRSRFTGLLIKSIELAGGNRNHVFVLSIPDYSVTPFAGQSDTAMISRQIDLFNMINKEVTTAYLCNYIDITPSTRMARFDPTLLANDGLHPSGKEYSKWATWLAEAIKQKL